MSFADDVALVARDQAEAELLVAAYLCWCKLLQLKVTVQVWSNTGRNREVLVGEERVCMVATFKIVGVVLGTDERLATGIACDPSYGESADDGEVV